MRTKWETQPLLLPSTSCPPLALPLARLPVRVQQPALAATATATATAAADPRPSGKNNVVATASAAAFCLHEMRHETKEEDDDYGDTL